MKQTVLYFLLICNLITYGQYSKVNIPLKFELEKHAEQEFFPLFVLGDASKIKEEVNRLEGKVIRSSGKIVQVELKTPNLNKIISQGTSNGERSVNYKKNKNNHIKHIFG